jgi:hypothetical protein
MLNEIYFRDPTDPKYNPNFLDTNNRLEALISKLKMILYSNRGDVLGDPDLGMDLEDYLFERRIDEATIKERFYAQVAKYIPERDYTIDLQFSYGTNNVTNHVNMFITINGQKIFGLAV